MSLRWVWLSTRPGETPTKVTVWPVSLVKRELAAGRVISLPEPPEDQWVRVMGGWSPYQFKEKRFPTVAELNDAFFIHNADLHTLRAKYECVIRQSNQLS